MAQKVQVMLVDDLDGGEAAETLGFSLDGVNYEIDLSTRNAAKLRDAMASWVGHARRVSGRSASAGGRRRAARGPRSGPDTATVREWARQNGFKVSDRGRISADVMAAYEKAHS